MASGLVGRMRTRKRLMIGLVMAIVALLAIATTAIAAGPGRFAPAGNGKTNGQGQGFHGPRAVITAVDASAQTITLGGLPQQVATVKVTSDVTLVALQADGTTKPATFTDFTVGSIVEVGIKGPGRGARNPGGNASPPSGTQGQPNVTVTQLALVPAGQVRVDGLVLSTGSGSFQILEGGGLKLTVQAGSAKVTTGNQNTAASLTDVKVGSRVSVSGTQSADTVTATTVRIFDFSNLQGRGNRPGMGKPNGPNPNAPTGTGTATGTAKP